MAYFVLTFILSAIVALSASAPIKFYQLPGKFVDISAKGDEVWAIDRHRKVSRFDFDKGEWIQIASNPNDGVTNGQPNTIGASPDGWTWITTTTHKLYRYNPTSKKWVQMGGPHDWLWQVSAISKDLAVGQGGGDKVWILTFPHPNAISGNVKTRWSACAEVDDECWVIEKDTKKLWRTTLNDKTGKTNAWVQMPGVSPEPDNGAFSKGVAEKIDVQSATRGVMTATNGQVYMWTGSEWHNLPVENAAKATIGSSRVFVLDQVENVIMANL